VVGIRVNSNLTITTLERGANYGANVSTDGYTAGYQGDDDIRTLVVSAGEAELIYGDGFLSYEETT
jgi:hypothetical protein